MLSWIREKFGTAIIGAIISLIALVFIFYGIFSPKNTRGLGEGAVAGTVNGDPISLAEFNRAYKQQEEFFKNMAGGKFSDEQLKSFHIRERVFQDLVRKKLMSQEAEHQGLVASEEELRDQIKKVPAFQKSGQFDLVTYKQVLEANNYSPASFEHMMRDDISTQHWADYFRARVHISNDEVQDEFTISQNKRNLKYVLLTSEVGQKGVKIDTFEVTKYLADPTKLNIAKAQYEQKKAFTYKGKTFDQVKESIAHDILASSKVEEVHKMNESLGAQVAALLKADKGSDAKINALLKPYGAEVKSTGFITKLNPFIPGIGEASELMNDAFASASPIEGKAKKYNSAAWVLVATVSESQKPDLSKLDSERQTLIKQVSQRKEREFFEEWMKKVSAKAKIDPNPAVLQSES